MINLKYKPNWSNLINLVKLYYRVNRLTTITANWVADLDQIFDHNNKQIDWPVDQDFQNF